MAEESWRPLTLRPWELGEAGKGVLTRQGGLYTWATDAEGAPHHSGGLRVLGVGAAAVACYLELSPAGETNLTGDDEGFAIVVASLDDRLTVTTGWSF